MSSEANGLHINRRNGYVYVARGHKGFVKVGGAANINTRMAQLRRKDQTIKLVAAIKSDRYMYLEKFVHIELKDYQVANEWYRKEKEVIKKIVDFLSKHGEIFGAYEVLFTSPRSQGIA